jgi:hypothetical protein
VKRKQPNDKEQVTVKALLNKDNMSKRLYTLNYDRISDIIKVLAALKCGVLECRKWEHMLFVIIAGGLHQEATSDEFKEIEKALVEQTLFHEFDRLVENWQKADQAEEANAS